MFSFRNLKTATRIAAVAGTALTACALAGPAAYAGTTPASSAPSGQTVHVKVSPGLGKRVSCSPKAEGDLVHISGSDVSGHGWWKLGNCTARKATVSIVLQEFINGGWRGRGQGGQKTVFAGGGSANRATARATCLHHTVMRWRSHIDVSVVGESGTASATTPSVSRACMVP